MNPRLLILGGTTGATALACAAAAAGIDGVVSLAGRVARPARQPLPLRIGGFGGVEGLTEHLCAGGYTHLVDATHPFAANISANAVGASAAAGVPLAALTRPPWSPGAGDRWTRVADIPAAVAALDGPARRVMLAIGRMHLAAFAPQPQHFYLLRLVDPLDTPPPLPHRAVIIDRGPFTECADIALMQTHAIDLVVSKNSGGPGARAKIDAARKLGLPVIMIDRPPTPPRREFGTPQQVLDWVGHSTVHLGV